MWRVTLYRQKNGNPNPAAETVLEGKGPEGHRRFCRVCDTSAQTVDDVTNFPLLACRSSASAIKQQS